MAEALNAAKYLVDSDELEKNFEGRRDNYKRSPRKLGTDDLDKNSELQEYQGVLLLLLLSLLFLSYCEGLKITYLNY